MRYQKLDALRWWALIGMVMFHANFILENVFGVFSLHFSGTFWFVLGRTVAILFILVSGISFFLFAQKRDTRQIIKNAFRRFILLTTTAMLITAVTYIFFYEQRISFGIIHFFAAATLAGLIFVRLWASNIIFGIIILIGGYYFRYHYVDTQLLIPFWFYPSDYYSADYYPLIPWFGYYLIGYGVAYWLKKRGYFEEIFSGSFIGGATFASVGRHSLLLYIIHVPIVYGILSIFFQS